MYKLLKDWLGNPRSDLVLRTTDSAYIPADNANTDWQNYQAWLTDGNTPEAAD